jgi:DNA repair protein RadA/Sms
VEKTIASATLAKPMALPQELSLVSIEAQRRLVLPFSEFNRVLGGGIVPGSLVLIGGDPGIGKSTLLLQVAAMVAQQEGDVLYASGEESAPQMKLRAERLKLTGNGVYLLPETSIESILEQGNKLQPKLMVIDSIQTVSVDDLSSAPGSVAQVRECTLRLMEWAKLSGIPVFLVGHVTKEGSIAGPRVLEHIVDVVLYLEGEHFSSYRLLRGVKNRFGSTDEIGIFEMRDQGLVEVDNPSQAFLSQRAEGAIGSVIAPTLEGTRPILVEIQALTNPTSFGLPRRTANGVDFNRLLLLAAVLTRRAGVSLSQQDIIVNVTGGIKIAEPAADLGIALAIASSFRGIGVNADMVAIGEVGLSGELRAVSQSERRISEAAKLGFRICLLPQASQVGVSSAMELIAVSSLSEALKKALV